jgi:8-oxo-dGTP diphosphatase
VTRIVVGAAIIAGDRLLAAQRAEPPEHAGRWEFPGGKVRAGEADQDALVRECREELGVAVKLGERVGGDWPLPGPAPGPVPGRVPETRVLRVWTARLVDGTPRPFVHLDLRWLSAAELYDVAWLAADLPVVAAIRDRL